jgi:hypothetical protein
VKVGLPQLLKYFNALHHNLLEQLLHIGCQLMLRPISKGAGSSDSSLLEVPITGSKNVYFDTTSDHWGAIVDGRIQQTVLPFHAHNINPGDTVLARGAAFG